MGEAKKEGTRRSAYVAEICAAANTRQLLTAKYACMYPLFVS